MSSGRHRPAGGLYLLVAVTLSTAAVADAEEGGRPLALAEATRLALEKNHDIALEREDVTIAGAAVGGARGFYDPSLRLDARYRDHTDPSNSILSGAPPGEVSPRQKGASGSASLSQLLGTGATLTASAAVSRDRTDSQLALLTPAWSTMFGLDLRQPLLQNRAIDPARRAIRIARADEARSLASLRRIVAESVAAVEASYWSLVAAQRNVAVRESSLSLAEEQRRETRTKIDAGVLPESDLAQTTAEVERRRGDLYAAREARARAENQLKGLILESAEDSIWSEPISPSDPPEVPIVPVDREAMLAEAGRGRPEIAEARARLARQGIEVEAARNRVLPQLDLALDYSRRGLAGSSNPDTFALGGVAVTAPDPIVGGLGRALGTVGENRFPDLSVGFALALPLGNRAARADAASAEAANRQAQIVLDRVRQQVALEVRNAIDAVETAAQRIEAAKAGIEAAQAQLRAENDRFDVGASSNFFVLARQNDLAQARLTETAALTDYRKARTELSRAAGSLLEDRDIRLSDGSPAEQDRGAPR